MQNKQKIEDFILKTEKIDVSDLVPLQGELKKLDDIRFNKLRNSLIEKGFRFTLHAWESGNINYILDGHQRVHVLQQLKKQGFEIPKLTVNFVKAKDFHEAKELILYAVSQYGKIDKDGFEDFINGLDLDFGKFDLPDFEYDFSELGESKIDHEKDPDDVPEIPEDENPYNVRRGQIWKLGNHRLMCGDSTSEKDVAKLMDGEKADMCFTDPPYNIASNSKNHASKCENKWFGKSMKDLSNSDWDKNFNINKSCKIISDNCTDQSTSYIWTSHFLIQDIWNNLNKTYEFTSYLVWSKTNPMPSISKRHPAWNTELCVYASRGSKRVVNYPNEGNFLSCRHLPKKSDGTHPTQKPIELIEPIIEFSSNKDQIVLDLFLGSGSTLIACEKTGRMCYGMEIDIKYMNVIIKRWEDYTRQTAELIVN